MDLLSVHPISKLAITRRYLTALKEVWVKILFDERTVVEVVIQIPMNYNKCKREETLVCRDVEIQLER